MKMPSIEEFDAEADSIAGAAYSSDYDAAPAIKRLLRRALASQAQSMLGEVWMPFGEHEGHLIALPEYAAASQHAVAEKVLDGARREGFAGTAAERLAALGWTVRRLVLADGVRRTFAEHLEREVAEGGEFPRLFASTEW